MRKDIDFKTEDGVRLRGWHYVPERAHGKAPTVAMAHGYSAVKEMYLDRFAETFTAAGLACLVYDNRNFGASDGAPRQEIDLWLQVRDYRDAITFAETLEATDPDRIGIWGCELLRSRGLSVVRHRRAFLACSSGDSRLGCAYDRRSSRPPYPALASTSPRLVKIGLSMWLVAQTTGLGCE